ncbi:uncharacterized protein LOC129758356 [Uranotaenia lowii]|uniref:uncharacterized protein LOC129758356 n=1 Tax=Uranotaenia lowii TaxID=190385 RepID=UPI00247995EC|nr:uncharacterized protein LOC129758356 [Uranotaenia lowii]
MNSPLLNFFGTSDIVKRIEKIVTAQICRFCLRTSQLSLIDIEDESLNELVEAYTSYDLNQGDQPRYVCVRCSRVMTLIRKFHSVRTEAVEKVKGFLYRKADWPGAVTETFDEFDDMEDRYVRSSSPTLENPSKRFCMWEDSGVSQGSLSESDSSSVMSIPARPWSDIGEQFYAPIESESEKEKDCVRLVSSGTQTDAELETESSDSESETEEDDESEPDEWDYAIEEEDEHDSGIEEEDDDGDYFKNLLDDLVR